MRRKIKLFTGSDKTLKQKMEVAGFTLSGFVIYNQNFETVLKQVYKKDNVNYYVSNYDEKKTYVYIYTLDNLKEYDLEMLAS